MEIETDGGVGEYVSVCSSIFYSFFFFLVVFPHGPVSQALRAIINIEKIPENGKALRLNNV